MKVLIYGNRKEPDTIWDISTPEKEEAAYRELFANLDGYWQAYSELTEVEEKEICEPCQKDIHRLCEEPEDCACTNKTCPSVGRSYDRTIKARWPALYAKAKAGDFAAMKKLMTERSQRNYEYEEFRLNEVKDATAKVLA